MHVRTRSPQHVIGLIVLCVSTALVVSCGDGGSSPTSPGETSFLSGAWNGTLAVTPTGQADVSGSTTWTFDVVPQSNRQSLNLRIQSSNSWIPGTMTTLITLAPSPDPPGRIGGTGNYSSPRGCTGDFVVLADVTASSIDGTFSGVDCVQGLGRTGFDGVVHLRR
jgi:hypothetical protein